MLLQKFPKTVSYTVIMAVIPKINENSVSGGGGMRSVSYTHLAMVAGVILLGRMLQTQTNEAFLYLGGACLLILVGVYELHRQIPLLLHRFAKQNLCHKYKEENLFFLGQIGRRIHSAGRTMACLLYTSRCV